MSKSAIAKAIRESTGCTADQASAAVDAVIDAIVDGVKAEGRFPIIGFGNFALSERPTRPGRNPRTGEAIELPASRSIKFSASATLKKSL